MLARLAKRASVQPSCSSVPSALRTTWACSNASKGKWRERTGMSAYDGAQRICFSTSAPKFKTYKINRREIRTLDPSRLESVDQQIIDVSNKSYPEIIFPNISPPPAPTTTTTTTNESNTEVEKKKALKTPYDRHRMIYALTYDGAQHRIKFPENTRGVLYYHKADPEVASSVRFRICDEPTLASFKSGRDLIEHEHKFDSNARLFSYREPWNIPLHAIACSESFYSFRAELLQENLVDSAMIDDLRAIGIPKRLTRALYSYNQAFIVDLSKRQIRLTLVSRHCVHDLELQLFSAYPDTRSAVGTYEGFALARLVLSPLREHIQDPSLLLQFVKFLTPIRRVRPEDMIKKPMLGKFLEYQDRRTGTFSPWAISLKWKAAGPKFVEAFGMPTPVKLGKKVLKE
ncbi:hypothetical protein CPC08DRAFT_266553 [Agrocybe pediades]|nr:hypothetical protein CPC08DRAFT_266553 [Agrocybe pediades]